jgi:hypothetical protein
MSGNATGGRAITDQPAGLFRAIGDIMYRTAAFCDYDLNQNVNLSAACINPRDRSAGYAGKTNFSSGGKAWRKP